RSKLINSRFSLFVSTETRSVFNLFLDKAFENKNQETCEVTLVKDGDSPTHVLLTGIVAENEEFCNITMVDITEHKLAEEKIEFLAKFPSENPSPVLRIDKNGYLLYANEAGFTLLPEWNLQVGKPTIPILRKAVLQTIQDEKTQTLEIKYDRRLYSFFVTPIIAEGYVNFYASDITEHKEAEEALKENEERYKQIYQFSPDSIIILDMDMNILDANDKAVEEFGYSKVELLKKKIIELHPEAEQKHSAQVLASINKKDMLNVETKFMRKDGSAFLAEATPCKYTLGSKPIIHVVIRDITEHKLAEESVQKERKMLRTLIDNLPDPIYVKDAEGRKLIANPADIKNIGKKSEADVLGKTDMELFPGKIGARGFADDQKIMQTGIPVISREENFFDAKKQQLWLLTTKIPLINEKGETTGLVGIGRDITERKQAEEKIREKDLQFRKLSSNLPDLIYQFTQRPDGSYFVPVASEGIKNIFGCSPEDVIEDFTPIAKVIYPEDAERVISDIEYSAKHLTYFTCEFRVQIPGKPVQWIYSRSSPEKLADGSITWYGFNSDITERKQAEKEREKLQAQLTQAQKMESIGRLAGGVAHDFNNMLGVILGNTEMILEELDPNMPTYDELEEIKKAAQRSADLTRQLLAFARKQTVTPEVLDLNQTLEGMLKMLRSMIGENIELVWLPGKNLDPIKIDPSQIDQLLANLCVNASDSIEDVGKITIETSSTVFDEDYCSKHADFMPGEFIMLTVKDDGCGMNQDTLDMIFEPFFTTKELGKGTGLGLATIYGIVKQNNGFINAYSQPGQGTTFNIYLPRHIAKTEQIQEKDPAKPDVGDHETILLAEDETAILRITTKMLEKLGYKVVAAATPGEAIRLAEEHTNPIHMLITDVVMPEMNGRDLAKNILTLYPNIKRLFMSGYTANVIAHQGVLDKGVNFIQKPFSIKELAAKVQEIMQNE
nr:PAS domain S-box protein [Kiritimatiellia bacterium]